MTDISEPGTAVRHRRGGRYIVLERARHSETLEPLVVYVSREGPMDVWARPAELFEDGRFTRDLDGGTGGEWEVPAWAALAGLLGMCVLMVRGAGSFLGWW